MLINKWLVIDSFASGDKEWKGGFCLDVCHHVAKMSDLYKELQASPRENSFAILLSEKDFLIQNSHDSYIDNIITLFFQPSYFLAGDKPVVFVSEKGIDFRFIRKLSAKCENQGLFVLMVKIERGVGAGPSAGQFAYEVTAADIDYSAIIKNWLSQFTKGKDPEEIHLLFNTSEPIATEILSKLREKEMALFNTEHYKFASALYEKQKLIDKYKKELELKNDVEKSTQLYLALQKKQTADNVEWYYHEYEILPTWYKRFGHVIKVLMGKRTFRSLFSDKVKKYKE